MKGKYMPISYEWLQSFFEKPLPSPDELAKLITNGTFEIEDMLPEGDDWALDVKVLPDRASDAFSHRGIAHEVSVLTGIPFSDPFSKEMPERMPTASSVILTLDTPLCDTHALALLRGVRVAESPLWLKKRLETIGQRSINNIVDATNYVMFELGQPVHVFDWNKLREEDGARGIRVRMAYADESITLLGGDTRTLNKSTMVLADAVSGRALDIAGIKGGTEAELTNDTTDILVTVAHFDAVAIRKTSRALDVRTDASKRFENNIPRAFVPYAIARTVALIQEIAGGTLVGYQNKGIEAPAKNMVAVSRARINGLLGTSLSAQDICALLERQGFATTEEGDMLHVVVPFERNDIAIPEDVVEEVARVYGYNTIPDTPLPHVTEPPEHHIQFRTAEAVRALLGQHGYAEVMTYTLTASGAVHLKNAFASDKSALRDTLVPGIQEALNKNEYASPLLGEHESIRLYEIGSVFLADGSEDVRVCIGVRMLGGKNRAQRAAEEIKTMIDALKKTFALSLSDTLHSDGGVTEFSLSALAQHAPARALVAPHMDMVAYKPFSIYPFVLRDIAVWVPDTITPELVLGVIQEHAGDLLVRTDIFDTFSKEGKRSYAFHLVFQSMERTLTDSEVNEAMQKVENSLRAKGYEVR